MNACDNIRRPSQELDVARYLLYNWQLAGVSYRLVSKRGHFARIARISRKHLPDVRANTTLRFPLTASLASYRLSVYRDLFSATFLQTDAIRIRRSGS